MNTQSYQQILYDVSEGIATVTMNRPEQLNALTQQMYEEMRDAFAAATDDKGVHVIILTGAGRGFTAGADMNDLQSLSKKTGSRPQATFKARPLNAAPVTEFEGYRIFLPRIPKPVISAVNGPAAGMGFVFTLFADLRFASHKAIFTSSFSRRGLIAEHGVSWMLPRLVGIANATDILFSSRKVTAEEALRMGLVNRVITHDNLIAETRAYATELINNTSPKSIRIMKQQLYNDMTTSLQASMRTANHEMSVSMKGDDFKEGVAHFLEKRAPKFEPPFGD